MKKLLTAIAVATLSMSLVGCGSGSSNSSADSDTFTVGMECNYAPFNWQQSKKSSTASKLGSGAGYCDGYDVDVYYLDLYYTLFHHIFHLLFLI